MSKTEITFKNNKALLVQPPSRATTPRPPLGLMCLSSYLSKEGIDNEIVDIKGTERLDIIMDRILSRIKNACTDIVGITCLVTEIEIVENMCRLIKEAKPGVILVLGGAQVSSHPEHFINAKGYIDYFVIGEGEITFTELIKALRKNKDGRDEIRKIDGLAWFESGELRRSKPRELIKDLDNLPLPAYDKVEMDYYTQPTSWGSRPILLSLFWVFSSRGCPYRCKFCVAHEVFGRAARQRSPKNVVDEIEFLVKKYKVDGIYFYDESFTVNSKRAIEICDEIIRRDLKIVFGCQTRVNLISDAVLGKMAEAGFLQIDFGIESGSDKMLKSIQKDINVEQIKMAVKKCRQYGIRTFANMMVNLPDETLEDLNASINLMKELDCNVVIWNVTVPYPGTFLDKKLIREDYKKLMSFPSDEAYRLLESKYKFSSHDRNLKELVDYLYGIFPHPRYINFKIDPNYWRRWLLFVNFIFNPRYIAVILRSRRKLQYLKSIFLQATHN